MRRSWLFVALACMSVALGAQHTVTPLPPQEQFVARTGLKATLRLSSSAFGVGQILTMWVMLENTGTRPLRIPGAYGTARLLAAETGRELYVSRCGITNSTTGPPLRIGAMPSLAPRRTREFEFSPWCHIRMELPPGPYQIQAAIWNYAGFPSLYDVYERGADEVWEGTLPIPPVSFVMLPAQISSNRSDAGLQPAGAAPAAPYSGWPFPVLQDVTFAAPPEPQYLGDYLSAVIDGGDNQSLARQGISRFGDKAAYGPLRAAVGSTDEPKQYRAGVALAALTFTHDRADSTGNFISPAAWDAWWKRNGGRSREEWARDALSRLDDADEVLPANLISSAARAAEYLVTSSRGDQRIVSELSRHRSWGVRLSAADALASFDRRRAGELMIRELRNRYPAACEAASGRLRQLTDIGYTFNCFDPAEREQAITHWRAEVNRLSP